MLAPAMTAPDLSTTEIYTQVSIKKLKEVHTLTHPAKPHRSRSITETLEEVPPTPDTLRSTLAAELVDDPE